MIRMYFYIGHNIIYCYNCIIITTVFLCVTYSKTVNSKDICFSLQKKIKIMNIFHQKYCHYLIIMYVFQMYVYKFIIIIYIWRRSSVGRVTLPSNRSAKYWKMTDSTRVSRQLVWDTQPLWPRVIRIRGIT